VQSYDGSGDWFKVWESGLSGPVSDENNWGTWQDDRISFTIPADTPDGEYLVRPEHIAIHEGHVDKAQFYMECAQLRVNGGGSGTPGPMVKIPGLYTPNEVNFDMWSNPSLSEYPMPGPAVWGGGGSGSSGTADGSTGNSTGGGAVVAQEAPAPTAAATTAAAPPPAAAPSGFDTVVSGQAAPTGAPAAPAMGGAAPEWSQPEPTQPQENGSAQPAADGSAPPPASWGSWGNNYWKGGWGHGN